MFLLVHIVFIAFNVRNCTSKAQTSQMQCPFSEIALHGVLGGVLPNQWLQIWLHCSLSRSACDITTSRQGPRFQQRFKFGADWCKRLVHDGFGISQQFQRIPKDLAVVQYEDLMSQRCGLFHSTRFSGKYFCYETKWGWPRLPGPEKAMPQWPMEVEIWSARNEKGLKLPES